MAKIICFHLFNDYSGSPKVLKMVLEGLLRKGIRVDLVSSRGGILDELLTYKNLRKSSYQYSFSKNPVITILCYTAIQFYTFLLAFRYLFKKETIFYINTLLPVGPALAGRLMGKRVVYQYHENAFIKGAFYKGLCRAMQLVASEIICVSEYQRSFLKRIKNVTTIPNALPEEFISRLLPDSSAAFKRKRVLMIGSLKLYKGVLEYIKLAQQLSQLNFEFVVNDTQENIDRFVMEHNLILPLNLTIYPRQNDVVPFYNNASLLLNLSNKKVILETFGLTALEAMSAGLPVIVPTVGGIAEMVEDGVNGYKIDVQDLDKIAKHIQMVLSDKATYMNLAHNAFASSQRYDANRMVNNIIAYLN